MELKVGVCGEWTRVEWRAQVKDGGGFGQSGGAKMKISSQSRDNSGDRSDKI